MCLHRGMAVQFGEVEALKEISMALLSYSESTVVYLHLRRTLVV